MVGQQYDRTWKNIQLNTFTRWVQQKLKQVNVMITDLETDFEEGLKLIRLVEVLSGKSLGRYNKKVSFRHQKLENISLALQFLENEEHIKLINIDSTAIADHNLKLTLGLIWTLILHYSISKQIWYDHHLNGELENDEKSAREKLLSWLRVKLPNELSVTNFTSDWNNGILLGALVDSCAPDLKIDWRKWLPSEALQSTFTAMQLANDNLGVAILIEPEELISPAVDEKSVMTYLSQFPGAKYMPSFGQLHDVVLMPTVGIDTVFTIHTRDTMIVPEVIIKRPDESPIYYIQRQLSENIYEIKYQPEIIGEYEITVTFRDNSSNDSTKLITANVTATEGIDISSISINGLNKESVTVGQRQDIVIDIGNLTPVKNGLEVSVEEEADGSKYLISLGHEDNSNIYKGFWIAEKLGKSKVCVFFDQNLVHEYIIFVKPDEGAISYRAIGEGIKRALVGVPAKFLVDMTNNGKDKVEVVIKGPSKVITNVVDNHNGSYTVKYMIDTPGLYEIMIYYGDRGKQIPGSPFMIMADYERDPSKILITGYCNGIARAKRRNSFFVDATLTALEPITAYLSDHFEQPIVKEIKSRIYQISFVAPATVNEIIILKLMYGNEIIGKPMFFVVKSEEDLELMVLKDRSGSFLSSIEKASYQFEALIDVRKVEKIDQLVVQIKGPDNMLRNSTLIKNNHEKMYLMNFVPDIAGLYFITVYINGMPYSSPYNLTAVPVGLANKCFVETKFFDKYWIAGESKVFTINTKYGGPGRINVISDMTDLETKIDKNDDGIYTATLTPYTEGRHRIILLFGGISIPGAVFDFECISSDTDDEDSGEIESDNNEFLQHTFRFHVSSEYEFDKLTAIVKRPSGIEDIAYIENDEDNNVLVKYQPKEYGSHLLSMKHDNVNMNGSPLSFYINEADDDYTTVYGPGLLQAFVGEPAPFLVCAKGSPVKELSLAIEGDTKPAIKCYDNKDGTCSVSWIPPIPGEYKIHVKLAGKPVKNSPFIVNAIDEDEQKQAYFYLESSAATSEALISVDNTGIENLSALVRSPSGIEESCIIRPIDTTQIGISFSPHEIGEHLITIKDNEQIIQQSNFQIDTIENEVGDASKVIVSGTGKTDAICQQDNSIIVDMHDAGYGDLSVLIQGPSKAEMRCIENNEGLANIVYKPTEPGIYNLSIKFAGIDVNDSPFTINCTGEGMGIVKESAIKDVAQVPVVRRERDIAIYMLIENILLKDTEVKIINPNGYNDDARIRNLGDNLYRIEFTPVVDGPHIISIFNNEEHVLGSPFKFTVGHVTEFGSHKVYASGYGLKRAEANKKQFFNLYLREAGEGELEVIIEGPSKADLQFHEHEDGNCHLYYKVMKAGEYLISVKFNAEHVPDSPFKVFVAPATGEVRRLELVPLSDCGVPGEVYDFIINKHGATGHLEAKLHKSIDKIEAIDLHPIDNGNDNLYSGQFIPLETGDYYVDITLDDMRMYGSPFLFPIGKSQNSDPSVITVIGDGIRGGQTGQQYEFTIITCNAGKGFLQIQFDGPSKVILNSCEVEQGYKISFIALAPGAYYAAIKYSGIHIPGSPIKIIFEGKKFAGCKFGTSYIKIDTFDKVDKAIIDQIPSFSEDANEAMVNSLDLNKLSPSQLATLSIDTDLAAKVKGFILSQYGDMNVPGSPSSISF